MLADLRDATRQIRRRSLVSAGIVAIIAIAVATNTALFAVVDGLLLKPLPYRDSERLVSLRLPLPNAQRLTSADRIRLREAVEQTALLADRAVEGPGGLFDGQGDLTLINSAVSSNFFELLGVRPAFGNSLPADDQPGEGVPTVVIGDTLWRTRFGADPAIVGRPTVLDGRHVVVAGVMPPGFAFPRGTNIWSPVGPFQRQALPSVARLADGVTIDGVRKALSPVEVRPLREAVRPRGGLTLVLLLAGSAFLLLIGWTQVAALQLARFPARSREVGVRLALGASRTRLIRQFAVEGVVLSVGALAVAWPLASGLTDAVATLLPPEMMRGQQVPTDVRVFLFACGLSAAGVMACAVGPAAWLIRHPVADSLKGEGFARRGRPIGWRLRRVLITGQLAVTALLLYMAGLAAHAFVSVEYVDLGFQPAGGAFPICSR
jgi:putative ABC transport system permease protein